MIYIIGLIAAFVISALIVPYIKKAAIKLGAVDNPKEAKRKIHKKVMARGGGVAIFLAFIIVCFSLLPNFPKEFIGLLIAATMVLVVGLIDDIRRLSPWVKLVVQVAAALIAAIVFGITISNITLITKPSKFEDICLHKGNQKKFGYSISLSKTFGLFLIVVSRFPA